MKTTGDRIRFVRTTSGLKGEELGEILNVTKQAISNWENNNRLPDAEMLIKIANFFDVSVDWILCRTDNPNNKVFEAKVFKQFEETIKLEINKSYPYELSAKDIKILLENLETVGFDVDKLIEKTKK